jgi:hypothetical protein
MRIPGPGERLSRWILWIVAAALLVLVAVAVYQSRHWRLVNDAAQIDYVIFLMSKGFAPYGQIIEMNMPGIYMINSTVMHVLGGGSIAWRIFDAGLMVAMVAGMMRISREHRIAGFIAGMVFIVDHWADGSENLGQRDLIIAVLLIWAYAFLFDALRSRRWLPVFAMGLCLGAAATIKPTPLPFALLLLALMAQRWHSLGYGSPRKPLLAASAGIAIPLCVVAGYLVIHHAVHPFLYVLRVQLPFYAMQMRSGYAGLLMGAFEKREAILVALAGAVVLARRNIWNDWQHGMLLLGLYFGLASLIMQHKGMIYHRYSLHAFLLLWAATQLVAALRENTRAAVQWIGVMGVLMFGIAGLHYVRVEHRRVWPEDFDRGVTADLEKLGGDRLSGKVQCLATYAECNTTLYRLKLVQATGLIYDFFLFGPGGARAVQDERRNFLAEVESRPPVVFILARGKFGSTLDEYDRPNVWPDFSAFLANHYFVYDQQNFPRDQLLREQGFRIYVLKQ